MPLLNKLIHQYGISLLQCARQLSKNSNERRRILEAAKEFLLKLAGFALPAPEGLSDHERKINADIWFETTVLTQKVFLELGNVDDAERWSQMLMEKL